MQDSRWILSFFPMILETALEFKYFVEFFKEKKQTSKKNDLGKNH